MFDRAGIKFRTDGIKDHVLVDFCGPNAVSTKQAALFYADALAYCYTMFSSRINISDYRRKILACTSLCGKTTGTTFYGDISGPLSDITLR